MQERFINEAKAAPPIDCEAFYAHAYAQYQAGQAAQAAEVFQVLCARSPMDSRYWFGLGASWQESLNFEKALHAWAMAALLDPQSPYPHFHAAQCAFSLNQTNDARLALQEAKERIKDLAHPLSETIDLLEKQWRNP